MFIFNYVRPRDLKDVPYSLHDYYKEVVITADRTKIMLEHNRNKRLSMKIIIFCYDIHKITTFFGCTNIFSL